MVRSFDGPKHVSVVLRVVGEKRREKSFEQKKRAQEHRTKKDWDQYFVSCVCVCVYVRVFCIKLVSIDVWFKCIWFHLHPYELGAVVQLRSHSHSFYFTSKRIDEYGWQWHTTIILTSSSIKCPLTLFQIATFNSTNEIRVENPNGVVASSLYAVGCWVVPRSVHLHCITTCFFSFLSSFTFRIQ